MISPGVFVLFCFLGDGCDVDGHGADDRFLIAVLHDPAT